MTAATYVSINRGRSDADVMIHVPAGDGRAAFRWGARDELGSACFWVEQVRQMPQVESYRWGKDLVEETIACLLGGYGIPMPMARAAFDALRSAGLTAASADITPSQVLEVLSRPLRIPGRSREARYRFARQRSERVAAALRAMSRAVPDLPPRELRDWLTQLPGVGPKTASFVVRNWTRSDDIAVIDIHIRRAGVAAGVFDRSWRLPRDYHKFETAFCAWAAHGGVGAADLDAYIWEQLSAMGNGARCLFGVNSLTELDRPMPAASETRQRRLDRE